MLLSQRQFLLQWSQMHDSFSNICTFFLLQLKRNVNQATHLHRMVILPRFLTGSKRYEGRWNSSMLNLGVLMKSKREDIY